MTKRNYVLQQKGEHDFLGKKGLGWGLCQGTESRTSRETDWEYWSLDGLWVMTATSKRDLICVRPLADQILSTQLGEGKVTGIFFLMTFPFPTAT